MKKETIKINIKLSIGIKIAGSEIIFMIFKLSFSPTIFSSPLPKEFIIKSVGTSPTMVA